MIVESKRKGDSGGSVTNHHTQNPRCSVSLFCALALFSQITLFIQTIWRFGSLEMQKINIRSTDGAYKTHLTILTVVARNWSFSRNVESCPLTWTQLARFTYNWLIRAAHISSLIGFRMTSVLFNILQASTWSRWGREEWRNAATLSTPVPSSSDRDIGLVGWSWGSGWLSSTTVPCTTTAVSSNLEQSFMNTHWTCLDRSSRSI